MNFSQLSVYSILTITTLLSATERCQPEVSFCGRFKSSCKIREGNAVASRNGRYWAVPTRHSTVGDIKTYTVTVYNNSGSAFTINNAANIPVISNSGYVAVSEPSAKNSILSLYNPYGKKVFSKVYPVSEAYGFNHSGNFFGLGTRDHFELINCLNRTTALYPKAYAFTVSDDGSFTALASSDPANPDAVTIYNGNKKIVTIKRKCLYIRGLDITPDNKTLVFIDKDVLYAYSVQSGTLIFKDTLTGNNAFMEVRAGADRIWAGIRRRNDDHTEYTGILKTYDLSGKLLNEDAQMKRVQPIEKLDYNYKQNEFPWPFSPQDQGIHWVWNGYLALSGASNSNSGAYLHQGTDLDVLEKANVLAVADGYTKCRLYIMDPSYLYWRICIAEENTSSATDGWMYAHLIESSITVQPGDAVKRGEQLGQIIKWDALSTGGQNRGHIHFSRVNDHGSTWSYTDDEWKNVCDPLALLRPCGDDSPPQFLAPETGTKFLFSTNDGSGTPRYLDPDALENSIDIVIKMTDVVGDSKWDQPAFAIHYWIRRIDNNKIVLPRTIGLIRNFTISDYNGSSYHQILPPIMYRMDSKCTMKSAWTESNRTFYHVVTNNNGDSTITSSDKNEALDTKQFGDGDHWITVEMQDAAGNVTVDSQQVYFDNGITYIDNVISAGKSPAFKIFPGTGANGTICRMSINLKEESRCNITLYGLSGKVISVILNETLTAGNHTINSDILHTLPEGLYLVSLKTGNKTYSKTLTNVY